MQTRGAGIGDLAFESGEVRGKGAEVLRVLAGYGADFIKAAQNGCFGAATIAGGFACTKAFHTIEAEDGIRLRLKLIDQREETACIVLVDFFRLRIKAGEEFAGDAA